MNKMIVRCIWLQDGKCHLVIKQQGEIDWQNRKVNYIELEDRIMSRQEWFNYKSELLALFADAGYVVSMVEKAEDTA